MTTWKGLNQDQNSSTMNINRYCYLFLLLLTTHISCARNTETIQVYSEAMQKAIPALVIKPSNYGEVTNSYSSLYLLHGAGGDYNGWARNVKNLQVLADRYQLIIICPDGGKTSWYFDSPIDPTYQYETHLAKELVTAIDQRYRTKKDRKYRAITGLSMGGHGALYLAARHPDIWGAAGSMSGGVDFRSFPNSWDIKKRLGTLAQHKERWEQHTVINMIDQLKHAKLAIMVDCGSEDFFFSSNQDFHQQLMKQQVSHDFVVRPGAHNWAYWENAIQYQIVFFDRYFNP